MLISKSFISSIGLNFTSTAIVACTNILVPALLIRFLSNEYFSFIAFTIVIQSIYFSIDYGLGIFLNKIAAFPSFDKKEMHEKTVLPLLSLCTLLSIFSSIILYIYIFENNDFIFSPFLNFDLFYAQILFVASLIPRLISTIIYSYLRGCEEFYLSAKIVIIFSLLRLIIPVITLYRTNFLFLYFLLILIINFLELITTFKFSFVKSILTLRSGFGIGLKSYLQNIKFIAPIFIGSMAGIIYSNIDKIFVKSITTDFEYKIYFSCSIISSIILLASSPVSQYFLPNLIKGKYKNNFNKIIKLYSKTLLILLMPFFYTIALGGKFILYIWFGADIDIFYESILTVLASSTMYILFCTILGATQVSSGRIKSFIISNTLGLFSLSIIVFYYSGNDILTFSIAYSLVSLFIFIIQLLFMYLNIEDRTTIFNILPSFSVHLFIVLFLTFISLHYSLDLFQVSTNNFYLPLIFCLSLYLVGIIFEFFLFYLIKLFENFYLYGKS